jgi:hypothetical protein
MVDGSGRIQKFRRVGLIASLVGFFAILVPVALGRGDAGFGLSVGPLERLLLFMLAAVLVVVQGVLYGISVTRRSR